MIFVQRDAQLFSPPAARQAKHLSLQIPYSIIAANQRLLSLLYPKEMFKLCWEHLRVTAADTVYHCSPTFLHTLFVHQYAYLLVLCCDAYFLLNAGSHVSRRFWRGHQSTLPEHSSKIWNNQRWIWHPSQKIFRLGSPTLFQPFQIRPNSGEFCNKREDCL